MAADFEKIQTFIGPDELDPLVAKLELQNCSGSHVITVSWAWSPHHSRVSEYRISADQDRQAYNLFEIWFDDFSEKKECACVATGSAYVGISDHFAAFRLLQTAWKAEMRFLEFDPSDPEIIEEGVLKKHDIDMLVSNLLFTNSSAWLSEQSHESVEALSSIISYPIGQDTIDTLDEIELLAETLQLPNDFMALCRHYNLDSPDIDELAEKLVDNIESLELTKENELSTLDNDIGLLVSELNPNPSRGGGINIPSLQQRVRVFLEGYAKLHNGLPKGSHKVHHHFGPVIDFDELREKYNI